MGQVRFVCVMCARAVRAVLCVVCVVCAAVCCAAVCVLCGVGRPAKHSQLRGWQRVIDPRLELVGHTATCIPRHICGSNELRQARVSRPITRPRRHRLASVMRWRQRRRGAGTGWEPERLVGVAEGILAASQRVQHPLDPAERKDPRSTMSRQ